MFNKQKKHFEKKLSDIERTIWDLEFKRFKTREIREEVRVEYDNAKSRLDVVTRQMETAPEEVKKQLEDQKKLLTRDADRYLEQIKGLDVEINGSAKTAEIPDGYDGISQQLDALEELRSMVKEYIKTL